MSFEQIQTVNIDCQTINKIPVNPSVEYRIGIDPTSNQDPFTGGLIVPSNVTQPYPLIFKVPLSIQDTPGLGFGNNFVYDPTNALTFAPGGDNTLIQVNRTGKYNISLQFDVLSNLTTPNNIGIFQLVPNGQAVFAGPPAISGGGSFSDISGTPIGGIFNITMICSGTANVSLTSGDLLCIVYYLQYDTSVIALTSNVSITLL